MKASEAQLDRALKKPAEVRFFLFHGPDEAGSRALAKRIGGTLGRDAERVELTGADLKSDPARLSDEAASISMFGGNRYIIVDPAGDETLTALDALESATAACNPVALVAGTLRPTSKLLKFALASKEGLAFGSYPPDGRKAEKLTVDLAREYGLAVPPAVAAQISAAANGNRALIIQELEKFALFLDAAPERPKSLDESVIEAVGADNGDGNLNQLVDSVAEGDGLRLESELERLASEGMRGIPLLRAMQRHVAEMARLQVSNERGGMASFASNPYQRRQQAAQRQAQRWPAELVAKVVERLAEAERQVKSSGGIGEMAADEELFALCRQVARLR